MLFLFTTVLVAQEMDIIGYYPSWNLHERNTLVDQRSIPYEKLTIINYAFFAPLNDGTIVGRNPEADAYLLQGIIDSLSGKTIPNSSLVDIAHQHDVKVLLSIGGWTDSDNFPQVSADPAKRSNFAHWCAQHTRTYNFDGMDIDWEYPGYGPHNGTKQDKENFTLLLKEIRDSLNVLGEQKNQYYYLSAALPASENHTTNIEVDKIAKILDFLNIMTYDFFGPWDATSNHNAPLYASIQNDSSQNFDGAFKLYHNSYGVPAKKINLGIPFYGHTFAGCVKLHGKHKGAAVDIFPEPGNATYFEIKNHMNLFTGYWDDNAKVPFLISKEKQILVSYDDEKSIGMKADYILDNKARGLIIWQIMGDYFENGETPLLDVIFNKFYGQE